MEHNRFITVKLLMSHCLTLPLQLCSYRIQVAFIFSTFISQKKCDGDFLLCTYLEFAALKSRGRADLRSAHRVSHVPKERMGKAGSAWVAAVLLSARGVAPVIAWNGCQRPPATGSDARSMQGWQSSLPPRQLREGRRQPKS